MAHYNNYDDRGYGEHEPLDNNSYYQQRPPPSPYHDHDPYQQDYHYEQPSQHYGGSQHYGTHPDSSFNRLRAERQQQRGNYAGAGAAAGGYAAANYPPAQGYSNNNNWGVTPGADNFGDQASGGMSGIAYNVADHNARESGVNAMRGYDDYHAPNPPQQAHYSPSPRPGPRGGMHDDSRSGTPGSSTPSRTPGAATPTRTPMGYLSPDAHGDSPYQSYSSGRNHDPNLGVVNPNDIYDDGDDGLQYAKPQRSSMLSFNSSRAGSSHAGAAAGAAGAGAAGAGGARGYNAVDTAEPEKPSPFLEKEKKSKKRWKWIAIFVLIFVVIGAIVGGVVGSLLNNSGGGSGGSGGSSDGGSGGGASGLTKESSDIKKIMNDKSLHKVFPAINYTPERTQLEWCHDDPPKQEDITLDLAILSRLTDTVRLYGTDCNQTAMVIQAIRELELDDMQIWMGVWIDGNSTTNARQLSQMYSLLDDYGSKYFKGVIVANEILFRKEKTLSELSSLLDEVRSNFTDLNIDLPVATSDLGDDWTSSLADSSDYIMSNVHAFFGGVPAEEAAEWTSAFWENNNGPIWKKDKSKNIIAELGWPTAGGNLCPGGKTSGCDDPAVASVEGLNTFLEDWVCDAMKNETQYIWFSAFDEDWKKKFDEPGKKWESKWGLLEHDRTLKKGITIPDCDGKTWGDRN